MKVWMGNDHTYMSGISGLRSQYYNASGRVLVAGLGLGILTLLLAEKKEVTEVIVVEIDPDVIRAFRANGWNEDKITLHTSPIQSFTDANKYDWILLDHYNQKGGLNLYYNLTQDIKQIIKNVGEPTNSVDCFTWEELYFFWLKRNQFTHSIDNYNTFAKPLCLPEYDIDTLDQYLSFYDIPSEGMNTPVDIVLSNKLKEMYFYRKPS